MFCYGVYVLWDKQWMWESVYCFVDYPYHSVSNEEFWYYNIESGYYLMQLIWQFIDVKRKDFWVMFTHHIATIALLYFSWATNFVRFGCAVMIIHDFADVPLEFGKMSDYIKRRTLANVIFVLFTVCWISSRVILFPIHVVYTATMNIVTPIQYFLIVFLYVLLCLHIIWTWYVLRIAMFIIRNKR